MAARGAPGAMRITYDDLRHTPDDGRRYEALEGVLAVSPAPKPGHQRVVANLILSVFAAMPRTTGGRWLTAPVDVVLGEHDVVQPDLLFVARERLGIIADDAVRGAPDLVVEVLSETSRGRDLGVKRHAYERCGVKVYWVVDPEEETLGVFSLRQGVYGDPAVLRPGQVLDCPLLGVAPGVAELFADD